MSKVNINRMKAIKARRKQKAGLAINEKLLTAKIQGLISDYRINKIKGDDVGFSISHNPLPPKLKLFNLKANEVIISMGS